MEKYNVLVSILETLRKEAPEKYRRYHVGRDEPQLYNNALAKLLIHLFLKVQYGMTDFEKREKHVTDGTYDGGIDGYFVDERAKRITLIQSKVNPTYSPSGREEMKNIA